MYGKATTGSNNAISCAGADFKYSADFFNRGVGYAEYDSAIIDVTLVDQYGKDIKHLFSIDLTKVIYDHDPITYSNGFNVQGTYGHEKINLQQSAGIDLNTAYVSWGDGYSVQPYLINTTDDNVRLRIKATYKESTVQGFVTFRYENKDYFICLAPMPNSTSKAIFFDENIVNCAMDSTYGGCSLHRDLAYYTNVNDTKSFYVRVINSSNVNNDNETITSSTFEKVFDGNILTLLSDADSIKKLKDIGINFSVTEVNSSFGTHRVLVSYNEYSYLFQTTRIDIAQNNVMEITYYENENDHYLGDGNNDFSRKLSADKKNISFCMCYNGKS